VGVNISSLRLFVWVSAPVASNELFSIDSLKRIESLKAWVLARIFFHSQSHLCLVLRERKDHYGENCCLGTHRGGRRVGDVCRFRNVIVLFCVGLGRLRVQRCVVVSVFGDIRSLMLLDSFLLLLSTRSFWLCVGGVAHQRNNTCATDLSSVRHH